MSINKSQNKSVKTPFYQKLGDFIIERETFDLDLHGEGYPTIDKVIAHEMLENETEWNRINMLINLSKDIKRSLPHAYAYIDSLDKEIYRVSMGGRNVVVITTNPEYRDAKVHHIERIGKLMTDKFDCTVNAVRRLCPDAASDLEVLSTGTKAILTNMNRIENSN